MSKFTHAFVQSRCLLTNVDVWPLGAAKKTQFFYCRGFIILGKRQRSVFIRTLARRMMPAVRPVSLQIVAFFAHPDQGQVKIIVRIQVLKQVSVEDFAAVPSPYLVALLCRWHPLTTDLNTELLGTLSYITWMDGWWITNYYNIITTTSQPQHHNNTINEWTFFNTPVSWY